MRPSGLPLREQSRDGVLKGDALGKSTPLPPADGRTKDGQPVKNQHATQPAQCPFAINFHTLLPAHTDNDDHDRCPANGGLRFLTTGHAADPVSPGLVGEARLR